MTSSANINLAIRLITAAIMVPAIVALLYCVPPIGFYSLVLIATLLGGLEFFRLSHPGDTIAQALGVFSCALVSLAVYFLSHDARVLLAVLVSLPVFALLVPLWRLGDLHTAALRVAAGAFGPLYVGCLTLLALLLKERGKDGPGYVLMTLMIAWFADTAGYFAGRFLGKHKLYEAVSPKKTVEGSLGGLAGSLLGVLWATFSYLKSIPVIHAVAVGLIGSAFGQLGDLGESLLKRSTGIKDSGGIVPGHGGILDRVDALLLASTVVYLYTRLRFGLRVTTWIHYAKKNEFSRSLGAHHRCFFRAWS